MKTLHLVLSYKWFDLIKSGQKTTEYREFNNYWNGRLIRPENWYKNVRFQRGYTKNPETILFEIEKIGITTETNDLNLPKAWAIRLGKRIEEEIKCQ